MTRTVLRNCRPVDGSELTDLAVGARGITEVGRCRRHPDDVEVDVGGRVVLPAFADVHLHLDKAGLYWEDGGTASDEPDRLRWASDRTRRLKEQLTVEEIRDRAERTVRHLVARGTTAMRTHVDVDTVIGLRGLDALLQVRDAVDELADLQISVLPTEPGWHHGGEGRQLVEAALERDITAIGGATSFVDDPRFYVDTVFDLASAHGIDVDLHVDESDDPQLLVLEHVAARATERGFVGRVVAGHCSTLSLAGPTDAQRTVAGVAEAGVTVVAMPTTNLYLLGAPDGPRGMTRVGDLLAGGAQVACASDNLQDPFSPYGNGDLLQVAALTGMVGRLGSPEAQAKLLEAITTVPRRAMGLAAGGLAPGGSGDLVVLDSRDPARILADQPARCWLVRRGRVFDPRSLLPATPGLAAPASATEAAR